MTKYAQGTEVKPEKTQQEIQTTLARYGATSFGFATTTTHAMVGFEAKGRRIKFIVPMPDPKERRFNVNHNHYGLTAKQKQARIDAEIRRRWRALLLAIKAKLEVVESGIATFDEEFLAYIVLPGGATVGESTLPRIAQAYESGAVMPLLEKF